MIKFIILLFVSSTCLGGTTSNIPTSTKIEYETTTITTQHLSNPSSCPDNSIEWNSHCYMFTKTLTNFGSAEIICSDHGGHLVSIHNENENAFLVEHATNLSSFSKYLWIGIIIVFNDGEYGGWLDDTPVDYNNFNPITSTPSPLDFCSQISLENGKWSVGSCLYNIPFICKVPYYIPTTEQHDVHFSSSISTFASVSTKSPTTTIKKVINKTTTISTNQNSPTTLASEIFILPSTTTKSSSSSTSLNFIQWSLICCGILIIICVILIIIYTQRKRITKIKKIYLQPHDDNNEFPAYVINLPHEQRKKVQLDPKIIQIDFENVLGKGAIASVYKGILKGKIQRQSLIKFFGNIFNQNVAVKMPKKLDDEEAEQFFRELDALIAIGFHSNIITFHGWTLYHNMPALVFELGDITLLQHVKLFRGKILPIKNILSILMQISHALEHLASIKLVHRDVACRNILILNNNIAKIIDFGLCCNCDDESSIYQGSLQKPLPLKWLSIEALVERKFSEKSDVWSFGILCFEAFSYGAIPYPTMNNFEMLEFLQAGNRLEKPNNTPDEIYALMIDCWKEFPQDRPNFKNIGESLRKMLENETAGYGYLSLDDVKIQK